MERQKSKHEKRERKKTGIKKPQNNNNKEMNQFRLYTKV